MKNDLVDDVDIGTVLETLWSGKILIASLTTFAALVSVFVALSIPNTYTATAVLSPAEEQAGGMGGLLQRYSGLASFAGVSLPAGEGVSKTQLGLEIMKSRSFLSEFVNRRELLPELMAVESVSLETGEIRFDQSIYDSETGEWTRNVVFPQPKRPSPLEAYEAFGEILTIAPDTKTGFIRVSVTHRSPKLATKWVTWVVEDVNRRVREADIQEASKSIAFLNEQASKTAVTDLQAVLYELIQSQTETMMLAQVRDEYVFKTVDAAFVPEKKSGPKRAIICILGTSATFLLTCVLVLGLRLKSHVNHNQ